MKYGDFTALLTDIRRDLAYVADIDTHEMIFMSHAVMEMAGISSEDEYRSRKCYRVLQGLDAPCPFCTNQYLLDGQSPYVWEQYNPVLRKWLRLEGYLLELDGRRCRGEWATDISQDHNTISSLQSRLELEQVLAKSIRTLALEPDTHTAVDLFLQYIGAYYQSDRVCIFEIDHSKAVVNNTYEWCAEGISSQRENFQNAPLANVMDWVTESADDAPQQLSWDSKNATAMIDVLSLRAVENLMVMPLRRDGVLIGFLGVDNAGRFSDDPALLRLSASFIAEEFQKRQLVWDLSRQEFSDRLTGLQNRNKYLRTLEAYHEKPPRTLAVFHLDLNGLKLINEQSGHDEGDRFICRCADILRSMNLNAFRVDGDEFIILQPEIDEYEARQMEYSLRAALAELEPHSISLGCAWKGGEVDVRALITEANSRMFVEKQIYYRTTLPQSQEYRAGAAADVLEAIRDGRFVVYFQPLVDLKTGAIYGAEALVRKLDEHGSIIPPGSFIPQYESKGIISHLDFHVLELVCRCMRDWKLELGRTPKISINFSRLTLMEPDIISRIRKICNRYGIHPGQFTIEVTESTGKISQEQLCSLVLGLQEAGFSVSLDDFGSEYSNLSVLTNIDFQLIKLDKSLIDQVGVEEKSAKLVKALISLCENTLSTPVLAEGVETREQADLLRTFSCDYVQGYYFSRPVPAEEFTAQLAEGKTYAL